MSEQINIRELRACGRNFLRLAVSFIILSLFVAILSPCAGGSALFHFTNITDKSLALFEGARPVFVYNHGVIHQAGVPTDRARSTYVHPLYGLDGEVLTDDFPRDHFHHRGLFWAWPHVRIGDKHYDLWMLKGIEQRFERWLSLKAGNDDATLGVQNGWFVGQRRVLQEEVWLRATRSSENERVLDIALTLLPIGEALTLPGRGGKELRRIDPALCATHQHRDHHTARPG